MEAKEFLLCLINQKSLDLALTLEHLHEGLVSVSSLGSTFICHLHAYLGSLHMGITNNPIFPVPILLRQSLFPTMLQKVKNLIWVEWFRSCSHFCVEQKSIFSTNKCGHLTPWDRQSPQAHVEWKWQKEDSSRKIDCPRKEEWILDSRHKNVYDIWLCVGRFYVLCISVST